MSLLILVVNKTKIPFFLEFIFLRRWMEEGRRQKINISELLI